jgi:hypothetical protein
MSVLVRECVLRVEDLKNIQRRWVSPVRITVTSAFTPAEADVTVMRMGRPHVR